MNFVYEIPRTSLCENSPSAQKPKLIDSRNKDYFVWSCKGKLHVAGSRSSSRIFKKQHVFKHSVMYADFGADGETVIFENDPENPDLLKRLEKEFRKPQLLKYRDDDFFVWKIGDYVYLFGDPLTNEKFIRFGEYPAERDVLYNAGPRGENVIYEIKEKKPDFSRFLLEKYLDAPQLIRQSCDNFSVWKYRQRYYVIGTHENSLRFETYQDIPHSKAFFSVGPGGETVIIEDVPGNPAFLDGLEKRFVRDFLQEEDS